MEKTLINSDFKLGILGGGQLGKMLALAANNWDLKTWILDKSKDFPAGNVCTHFVEGDFKNYDDVINFGRQVDVITIEIESVNAEALMQLKSEGKIIHPDPEPLQIIKDKGLQKEFYQQKNLPTSSFSFFENKNAILEGISSGALNFPFVQKARKDGYDGRGVAVIKDNSDIEKLLDCKSIVEPLVDIRKEIAVIVARNPSGEVKAFPVVEMEFNPIANLVEYLVCPSNIAPTLADKAKEIAIATIEAFDLCGLLAVELFLTNDNEILINEVAPRPHNSGHHTIDSCITSQFQQHLRSVLDLPLGDTSIQTPAVMVNLLGAPDHTGQAIYQNIEKCMAVDGAKFHLYGKTITKPFRKMGHATVVDKDLESAIAKAKFINETLNIIA